jgi:molybdenum cofactor cytidylyltransferase
MTTQVAAVVLAAGTSSRYGANKLLLPFGRGTVVSTVLSTLAQSAAHPLVVVTGHERTQVEAALDGLPVALAHNPDYQAGEMLSSIKRGLRHLSDTPEVTAALIVLGDQPLIQRRVVNHLVTAFVQGCGEIIAPRYRLNGPRGHPVLIARQWWEAVFALPPGANVRDLLQAHPAAVTHLVFDTDSILRDVDTPEAYRAARESAGS